MHSIRFILNLFFILCAPVCAHAQTVVQAAAQAETFAREGMFGDAERSLIIARQRARTPAEVRMVEAVGGKVQLLQTQAHVAERLKQVDEWAPVVELRSISLLPQGTFGRRGEALLFLDGNKGVMTAEQKERFLRHIERLITEFSITRAHASDYQLQMMQGDLARLLMRLYPNLEDEEQKRSAIGVLLTSSFPVSEGETAWYFEATVKKYDTMLAEGKCLSEQELGRYTFAYRVFAKRRGMHFAEEATPPKAKFLEKNCSKMVDGFVASGTKPQIVEQVIKARSPLALQDMLLARYRDSKK